MEFKEVRKFEFEGKIYELRCARSNRGYLIKIFDGDKYTGYQAQIPEDIAYSLSPFDEEKNLLDECFQHLETDFRRKLKEEIAKALKDIENAAKKVSK